MASTDAELISRYVELDPDRPGPAEARIIGTGVPVWALIGHYQATGRDPAYVAASYDLPLAAVEAALAYYRQHQAVIEARLAANAA
ncbi:MAG TPA: DUF433 domain-containing protein [Chloroflexota bacterium]|nr:DUF433 domain-containing protein [Chloroflexota bacterium]